MGATHINALQKISSVKVAGVCATTARALSGDLSEVGGNLDLPPARFDFTTVKKYTAWRELVTDPTLDAIDICLPTDLHASVAISALNAGKHVLCEKPMALTEADCHQMLEAAEKHGRVLMIGHVLRFWPEYETLRAIVANQEYGPIRHARFTRSAGLPAWSRWLPVEERSGGAVVDLLIHDIDQVLSLWGVPEQVTARSLGPVDTMAATLSYGPDLQVEISGGWLPAGEPFSMSFELRSAESRVELARDGLFVTTAEERVQLPTPVHSAYEEQIAYFVDCCRSSTKPGRCPPEQSAQALAVALLLKESRRREGQTVKCLV